MNVLGMFNLLPFSDGTQGPGRGRVPGSTSLRTAEGVLHPTRRGHLLGLEQDEPLRVHDYRGQECFKATTEVSRVQHFPSPSSKLLKHARAEVEDGASLTRAAERSAGLHQSLNSSVHFCFQKQRDIQT